MSKTINLVIDTNSIQERRDLVNFISSRKLAVSVINDEEGYQQIGISTGDVWFIGEVELLESVKLPLNNNHTHFLSVAEFYDRWEDK